MRELAAIQRRFYELVTAGEGAIDPGLLGTSRRLDVYADAYLARLHDVLADDYPKLRSALGDQRFREVATGYVRACPPASFTIRDAGRALADHLATRDDVPAWSAELAALERARIEVFDGADAGVWTREQLATLPPEAFPALALVLVPASAQVELRWSVDELWSAIEDDAVPHLPAPRTGRVLVWRRDLDVVHRTLEADEAELIAMLAHPTSLAEIAARLDELGGEDPARRMVELLERWLDAGVLAPA